MTPELNERLENVRQMLEESAAKDVKGLAGGAYEVIEDEELTILTREESVGGVGYNLTITFFDLGEALEGEEAAAYISLSKEEEAIEGKEYQYAGLSDVKRILKDAEKLWKSKVK